MAEVYKTPSIDRDVHDALARCYRVRVIGNDGSDFVPMVVNADGSINVVAQGLSFTGSISSTVTTFIGGSVTLNAVVNTAGSETLNALIAGTITAFVAGSVTLNAVVNTAASATGNQIVAGTVTAFLADALTDHIAFTQGSSKVLPAGFVFDDVAGSAISENDVAAARIDGKRAQVVRIEGQTRGLYIDGDPITNSLSVNVVASSAGTGIPTAVQDNANFVQDLARVTAPGYLFDEVAGTALTENDIAAARIDDKRAQVMTLEDATTRGQRLAVSSAGAASVAGTMTAFVANILPAHNVTAWIAGSVTLSIGLNSITGTVTANIVPGGTQAITGTVAVSAIAATTVISGTVTAFVAGSVDTELPAAAALADGTTNPTTPLIGSCQEKFDGSTWDRVQHSFVQITGTVATGGGLGTVVDISNSPKHKFAISVQKDGGTVSAYNIDLLGALQNWSFDTILSNNTSVTGGAQLIWTTEKPVRFMRYKVNSVTGAAGTVTIIIFACE